MDNSLQMILTKQRLFFLISLQFLCVFISHATTLVLPPAGDVVGEIQYTLSEANETIDEIGKRFDVGYYEIVRANPQIDTKRVLVNSRLVIPAQYILPDVPRKGIVINLAEYRLYYFPENENVVITFPVGIGRKGWNTPLGLTKIISKEANPKWRPTENLRAEAEKNGDFLPDEFPSGPYNPLGQHALRLGWPTFLIHGTNRLDGIGMRVSAGCIRMFPDDIEYLFHIVPTGTPVRVINEPVKIGKQEGKWVIQIHPLLSEQHSMSLQAALQNQLRINNLSNFINSKVIQNELAYPTGLIRKI
ncbi:putative ErfK/YbiS/YcfS/YnhG family protein precursor [Legionella steigerwaltii]|uniref:ErfK/YbiS/YcfS/YnhG family protein n=1 Tax=Legionella steigerwaltii TaxID=460 RepID=A0A378L8L5_9GAMM|nr:L,D-transpeptidase family protein [Legionella steigerwaltii]KTD81125.1 putative ErfK/YbiS/YcfS/YnhG family protein precursor [Legionella steigerwaltii]STY23186.1 putative ErfK/YbiS/YcfS/YnhG family protein precursor [Legionella steigerwaltii]